MPNNHQINHSSSSIIDEECSMFDHEDHGIIKKTTSFSDNNDKTSIQRMMTVKKLVDNKTKDEGDVSSNCSASINSSESEGFEDAIENVSSDSGDSGHLSELVTNSSSSSSHSSSDNNSTQSDDDLESSVLFMSSSTSKKGKDCPDLEESLVDIKRLLGMMLDNRFHEAYEGTDKWCDQSLYHALGKGTLSFLKGCLTLERAEVQKAIEDLNNCMNVCQRNKRHSMTRYVWRPNYNAYTDVEIHAELCYAEALLMTALLTFLEDQSLLSLVRGAFRIRACYQSYKECFYILNNRTKWSSEFSRLHFESGVRMGIGTFNLMLSHMPSKVLKLLEFVGFSGNRHQGFKELESSAFLTEGLRCPLAILIMLVYQCYIEHIFGLGAGDMNCVAQLLDYTLKLHPDGAFFLLFLGRHKQLTGKIDEAKLAFERCIASQNEWKQFHNICYWELLWCYSVQCQWENAARCADVLRQQCRWSPGAYTYQYATFLYMIMIEQDKPEMKTEITELLKRVPELRIRFAGKTIPAEKFAIIQSQKYFDQNERLMLPTIEFMYVWNIFAVIGQSEQLLNPILDRINKCLDQEQTKLDDEQHPWDDYCRCLLLKGMCLRYLKKEDESNKCFLKVIESKSKIKTDTYLIPHGIVELALNYMRSGQFADARHWLHDAEQHYSGYALETIVHFRIHTAIRTMNMAEKKLLKKSKKSVAGNNDDQNEQDEQDKHGGSFRTFWSEFARRLTFGGANQATSEKAIEEIANNDDDGERSSDEDNESTLKTGNDKTSGRKLY